MKSFLNKDRPLIYCPGCTHEKITQGLDKAMVSLGLKAEETVIVSDIGCSGLFDTRFNVHALHGVHGRALTYSAGLKLADPKLNIIVTMGDGGLGIGGAHLLAACRRNLDLTLIILNNFNFGMTGGQYSVTTPSDAHTGSGFLNKAEIPLNICAVAKSAGATYIDKCSGFDSNLPGRLGAAIQHKGFSIIETLGLCTGRYTKNNRLTPAMLEKMTKESRQYSGMIEKNQRPEYGEQYQRLATEGESYPEIKTYEKQVTVKDYKPQEIIILGSAGMRIVTAGEILCFAGIIAGMHVTMKTDYNITVLRGQSVSEILISPEKIGYTGIQIPTIVIALSDEGVQRRKKIFSMLTLNTLILKDKAVSVPDTKARIKEIDFKKLKIKKQDRALAAISMLAQNNKAMDQEMLTLALKKRYNKNILTDTMAFVQTIFDHKILM